jgi:hypothetical protein
MRPVRLPDGPLLFGPDGLTATLRTTLRHARFPADSS